MTASQDRTKRAKNDKHFNGFTSCLHYWWRENTAKASNSVTFRIAPPSLKLSATKPISFEKWFRHHLFQIYHHIIINNIPYKCSVPSHFLQFNAPVQSGWSPSGCCPHQAWKRPSGCSWWRPQSRQGPAQSIFHLEPWTLEW